MKSPFPYFGGKSSVARLVWERCGDTHNYVEPFAGSLAVLPSRPHEPRFETVNDIDCYIANFWRSLAADPEAVAKYADWPVNEADLQARHQWLVRQSKFRDRIISDPDYYDVKVAGWWVWGISQWIGSGWCDSCKYDTEEGTTSQVKHQLPNLKTGNVVHRVSLQCKTIRAMLPYLKRSMGIHSQRVQDIYSYFDALANRLRRVRVCCGDWSRICGPSPTYHVGLTAVFLDPPYSADRDNNIYAHDTQSLAEEIQQWCSDNENNPLLRIALCGYEGEYDLPCWDKVEWRTNGGYGNQGSEKARGKGNKGLERIWFSPHCLQPDRSEQLSLSLERLDG